MKVSDRPRALARENPWVLRAGVIALAVIVGVVAWLATRGGEDEGSGATAAESRTAGEPQIVEAAELPNIAAEVGHPVYWAGPIEATSIEVTQGSEGDVQVRYLEEGAQAGEGSGGVLTVGSYPLPDPLKALQRFEEQEGAVVRHGQDGRKVVTSKESPSSVYFISPDNAVQVEVYDPSPQRAMELALSGDVHPAE